MTRTTNARAAGAAFLIYIVAGVASAILFSRATGGEGMAAKLASIAQHPTAMRVIVLLGLVQCFSALVLAVTLFAITREEDPDLAMLALTCRVSEGVIGGLFVLPTLALLWLAGTTGAGAPDAPAAHALAAYMFIDRVALPATFFAVGSTLFSYLLLRGRMIPAWMAWLGVAASVLLVIGLPLRLAEFFTGPIAMVMWLPMLVFELVFAVWLLTKGVAAPARTQSA